MHDFFHKYFSFTKSERNGIIVLFLILIIVIIAPFFMDAFFTQEFVDYSEYAKEVNAISSKIKENSSTTSQNKRQFKLTNFNPNIVNGSELKDIGFNEIQTNNLIKYRKKGGYFYKKEDLKKIYGIDEALYNKLKKYIVINETKKIDTVTFKYFDPNTISPEEWAQLGLNNNLINTIQNYLHSGGKFFTKKDLLKIYGFNAELYTKLEPYIAIDTLLLNMHKKFNSKQLKSVEINSADTLELYKLFYNNKKLANRIIKYRNLLGGFYNIEQLKEVYGINNNTNFKYIKVDTSKIKKININTTDFKSLNKHPYVSYDETKAIFTYRKIMGGFKNINELFDNKLLNKKTFDKVKPYLEVESN